MKSSPFNAQWLNLLCRLSISGVLVLSAVNGNAITYYKSTGNHGEIRFSQFPPTNGKFEVIELRSDGRQVNAGQMAGTTDPNAQNNAPTAQDQEKQAMQKRIDELEKQENIRRCQSLRNNLASLNSGGRIYEQADDGSKQFLDDQTIEQRRDKIQQALNQYCSGQAT